MQAHQTASIGKEFAPSSHQARRGRPISRNHAGQIWACDAPSGHRSVLSAAFCVLRHRTQVATSDPCRRDTIALRSLGGPTTARSDPYGQAPKYPIRDNDSKFGPCFARVAKTSAMKILKTPYRAPRANAICERFMRSVRQECLNHLLIFHEKQFQRVLNAYVAYAQPSTTASRDWAADT